MSRIVESQDATVVGVTGPVVPYVVGGEAVSDARHDDVLGER